MIQPKVYKFSFTVVVEDITEEKKENPQSKETSQQAEKRNIPPETTTAALDTATVKRVIDADTIEVDLHGDTVDVRLLLVDGPETNHPNLKDEAFGSKANAFAKAVLEGKEVQLEYDGPKWDHYGRLLAYVWVDGKMFNQILLEEGLAHMAYAYHPPYKYYDRYLLAQTKAKNGRKGIWG